MPEDTAPTEVVKTETLKELTVKDLSDKILQKILADYGLTPDDLLDNENASKRPLYLKRAESEEALPMPTPDEEANLMAERIGINIEGRGHLGIEQIINNQKELTQRYRDYMLIQQSPRFLIWIAKFLLFFKRLFKGVK